MTIWQFCLCAGLAFLIAEIFIPTTFFLSMSVGAFATAIVAVWFTSKNVLIPVFAVVSLLSLLILKPFLAKYKNPNAESETGVEGKYIGKNAKALSDINENSGTISIYGERWDARAIDNEEIPKNSKVTIVKNESLVMYVEKSDK